VGHSREVKFRTGLDALSKKSIEDGRRRRSIEASVMEAQTNFYGIRHFPLSFQSKTQQLQSFKRWMGVQ
jgi:hypothetical protein